MLRIIECDPNRSYQYLIPKWDGRFLNQAYTLQTYSKDPRRKVGCVIVDDDKNILSDGFNGFPRKIKDTEARLSNKQLKNLLMVHAEANAVTKAARNGHRLKDGIAYCTQITCPPCAGLLIQSGIRKFVCSQQEDTSEATKEEFDIALNMFEEAEIEVVLYKGFSYPIL